MYAKDEIEVKLEFLESIFEKYGAVPLNINEKNMEKFHQRKIYQYKESTVPTLKIMGRFSWC